MRIDALKPTEIIMDDFRFNSCCPYLEEEYVLLRIIKDITEQIAPILITLINL